jgi:hypothetical protein
MGGTTPPLVLPCVEKRHSQKTLNMPHFPYPNYSFKKSLNIVLQLWYKFPDNGIKIKEITDSGYVNYGQKWHIVLLCKKKVKLSLDLCYIFPATTFNCLYFET